MVSRKTKRRGGVFIPDVVMINILSRVPARELAQFRCVCKSWNVMITDESLVKPHFDHSITNKACILYKPYQRHQPNLSLYSETEQNSVNLFNPTGLNNMKVVGSCNGVLCICDERLQSPICLWNPLTNKYTIIRSPLCGSRYLGFGVNSTSGRIDDFKVVSFSYYGGAKVYSLRTNLWKPITDRFPSFLEANLYPYDHPVLVNGNVHWCARVNKHHFREQHWWIVAFDFANEVFQTIAFPENLFSEDDSNFLKVVDGCLCVFSSVDSLFSIYELWVMREYGVVESWTRTHIIMRPDSQWWPLGCTSTGTVLARGICEHGENTLLTCEPVTGEFQCLGTHLLCRNPVQVLPFVESLIAPVISVANTRAHTI